MTAAWVRAAVGLAASSLVLAACAAGNEGASTGQQSSGNGGGGIGGAGDGGAASSGAQTSSSSSSSGSGPCVETCPSPNGGIKVDCKTRFMYGVNYAWDHFGADFGGISMWAQKGIAAEASVHQKNLTDMRAHGVDVIRWWVFPDFRSDGITFDGNENPTDLGGTVVADVQKALELAAATDVHLMLCIFSFDAFRPSAGLSGLWVPGITPMVTDAKKRTALMENVVRKLAKAAEASPHKSRLVAWDVINEPEWAITGPSPYGDADYTPLGEVTPVTHAQMETFVGDAIKILRAESSALVTVGGAAVKWAKAWSMVDLDFYQFHMYDWINQFWPYTLTPMDLGVTDKPIVMGEFPLSGLSGAPYASIVSSWYTNGFAGAMGWQYIEAKAGELDAVKAFADKHSCETHY